MLTPIARMRAGDVAGLTPMHSCPECDEACYCDGEDHDNGYFVDCVHLCDEYLDEDEDYASDQDSIRP